MTSLAGGTVVPLGLADFKLELGLGGKSPQTAILLIGEPKLLSRFGPAEHSILVASTTAVPTYAMEGWTHGRRVWRDAPAMFVEAFGPPILPFQPRENIALEIACVWAVE